MRNNVSRQSLVIIPPSAFIVHQLLRLHDQTLQDFQPLLPEVGRGQVDT